ncbi:tRNA (adenosine(37)-N6)-threonylcarbamoyltransferase complex ATPase subunit type 1 TsaE [Blastopirellula marina]|uniref:tRNA threonylcarbamoyladenosine biosynthesis protein TsaE n=1 Tax=Blastopirellula marina TaxID=124 RepID=A0A2S8GLE7_9BACT|nr:tRNA (adenosine(37)-N6)-threonylcarbamoyltransferase complex ATPase subunit type 1 TsaE [Blastopirellula marina]PQO45257.1 tRNA (adenosine(37)-N6)-threonylcarbamoyltransferase complex ATPase subunit type 1 TsaE [Blastopirellula marina]
MSTLTWEATSEEETHKLGKALAEIIPPGTVVAINGTLGAGKTRLVKAMADALGIPAEDVISPTFVIMQRYFGGKTLYHFDVYRIKDDDEFLELGPEEYFDSDGITLLEWADRVSNCLPRDYLRVDIEVLGETCRKFTISAVGKSLEAIPQQVQDAIAK